MVKLIETVNYVELWRDLVRLGIERRQHKAKPEITDQWHGKAAAFEQRVNDRWQKNDSSRSFLIQTLGEFPDSSVVDIGAGSGAWVSLISPHAKTVTAIDSSESMLSQLKQRVRNEGLENVRIIKGCWPDVKIKAHNISFCSHAMYGAEDFVEFINAIQTNTNKRIILLLRAPGEDGLMSQAFKLVWGHPYDSPNYQIAINILWQMGIFPNVIMEEDHLWKAWSHPTIDAALDEMKSRLGLFTSDEWDKKLRDLIETNLTFLGGEYVWPTAMRTALLYWDL
jgi:SAM-dependent methyltransferase